MSLDRARITTYVIEAADKMVRNIKEELRGKFVHLKFDCCSRLRVNYLGVNVRYINSDNEAVTKTIAVVDTKSQHTSLQLKTILEKVLAKYDLSWSSVISCVTDNASNMVRLVKDCNIQLASETQGNEDESDNSGEDSSDDDDDYGSISTGNSNSLNIFLLISNLNFLLCFILFLIFCLLLCFSSDIDAEHLLDVSLPVQISHVRCAAHTLQERLYS